MCIFCLFDDFVAYSFGRVRIVLNTKEKKPIQQRSDTYGDLQESPFRNLHYFNFFVAAETFLFVLETTHVIIRLNSRYCLYCRLPTEKVPVVQ